MTKTVQVGKLLLGGGNPVLVQSMTNTDTRDTEATLRQIRAPGVTSYASACTTRPARRR